MDPGINSVGLNVGHGWKAATVCHSLRLESMSVCREKGLYFWVKSFAVNTC